MRITKVETLAASVHQWVKIETDEGIVGIGDLHGGSGGSGTPFTVVAAVQYHAEYLIGKNPLEIERHWQHMFRRCLFRGGSDAMAALGAIDVALWDIAGKAAGLPVYRLLGGPTRDRVRVYVHLNGDTPEEMVDDAMRRVDEGYTALRFYPLGPFADGLPDSFQGVVRLMESFTAAVRDAVGPEMDLMIDVVNRLTPPEAIAAGRALEQYGLYFFEDPIEPDSIDAMAHVAAEIPIPIASGERLYTIYQFQELMKKNGSAYIRPDISVAGGITNLRKIAAIAEANYVGMVPHNPCSPVMTASCVQLDATLHNVAIQEYTGTEFELPKLDLVNEPLKLVDGHLLLPDRPGIGIELNEEAFKHYPQVPFDRKPVITSDGALRDY
ncbi:MAG: galactonate dehydratase [Chloroflexi bacterium]|nr:galactonate dehydratase [Chloroflexota bacterium]